jgi:NitT/TauT family transport system substrate-binding protein
MRRREFIAGLGGAAACPVVAGAQQAAVPGVALITVAASALNSATAPPASAAEKLQIRFTWKLKGEYAPLFVALDRGYYAAEGLDVDLAEGSGAETVVKMIGLGTDKIAYGPATVVAEAINQGLPVQVVAVYQSEVPIGLASFPDIPLTTPKDLEGKRLGVTTGETFANLLATFALVNHVDLTKVHTIQMNAPTRGTQFMARKLDVTSLYLSNELPLLEKKAGVKFNVLKMTDFGLKVMGASFWVNPAFAKANPETVRKLLRATAQGYVEAKKDYTAAAEIMEKHMPVKVDRDVLRQQVAATLDSTTDPNGRPVGWQDDAEWASNLDLLKRAGVIKDVKDPHVYYTNQYLR